MDGKRHRTWAIGCAVAMIAGGSVVASHQAAGSEIQASGNGTVTFNFVKTADWGSGYNARIDITNHGSTAINGWGAELDMPFNVHVNISSLPQCSASQNDNCWYIYNDVGIDNLVRIIETGSSNVLNPGQTVSLYLDGSYEGSFGYPTHCAAPHASFYETPVACNGGTDSTAPSSASDLRIFATGSTVVDLVWRPATDDVGVTGYIISYATRSAPAVEIGEVPATQPVTRARISRLVTETGYTFSVRARDAAGNTSSLVSSPFTTTTAPGMTATFNTTNTWSGGGFQGEFRITNTEVLPLRHWRTAFSFTGSFQSVWNGVLSGGSGSFSISAPDYHVELAPGETYVVGATGTFASPPTEPTNFTFTAGTFELFGERALATPQAPCLGLTCPGRTHCSVLDNGIPTCIPD